MSTVLEWPSIVCTVLRSLPAIKLAGRAVAQVIQPDRRQVGIADQAVEQLAEPVGFDRVTAGVGEHEPAHVALERGGGVVAEQDGEPVEHDQANAAGGLGVDQAASHRGVERHSQGDADAMQGGGGTSPTVAGGVRARIAKVVCTS